MISTFVEDHLLLSGGEPAQRSSRRGCWPRTFGFMWSMVLLASRHRICIEDMSYTKHFVWNALPEERAAGCRQSVGAPPFYGGAAVSRGRFIRRAPAVPYPEG